MRSVGQDRMSKLGRRVLLCYDNAINAVSLLHSRLEPNMAVVNIHMLSTNVQGGSSSS